MSNVGCNVQDVRDLGFEEYGDEHTLVHYVSFRASLFSFNRSYLSAIEGHGDSISMVLPAEFCPKVGPWNAFYPSKR